jgi:DNA ligase-associated metallophosphoesterase
MLSVLHTVCNQSLWLSPARVLYWEEQQALVVSDLHFGKTGHFRKAGIAVPQQVFKEDIQRFVAAMAHFGPRRIIMVGDLFHSVHNRELDLFSRWRSDLGDVRFTLVKGNHDVLPSDWYAQAGIEVYHESLQLDNLFFTHDPLPPPLPELPQPQPQSQSQPPPPYRITGHLHPGVRFRGSGKQSLSFPCFYFGANHAVLPAFSSFTGLALVEPAPGDAVFAIVNQSIMQVAENEKSKPRRRKG